MRTCANRAYRGCSTAVYAPSGPPTASTRVEDRALARAREILATHEPLPLPEGPAFPGHRVSPHLVSIAAAADDLPAWVGH